MPDDALTARHDPSKATSHPSDDPAALREQNRLLADLTNELHDVLRAVRAFADGCRAGALTDEAVIAARLRPILAGLELSCPRCAARRIEDRRRAELLSGLADLQRVEAAG